MSERVRVILIGDHAVVRESLRAVLEEEIDLDVVADFANARDATGGDRRPHAGGMEALRKGLVPL